MAAINCNYDCTNQSIQTFGDSITYDTPWITLLFANFTQPITYDREAVPGTTCANALASVSVASATAAADPPGGGTSGKTAAQFYNKYRRASVILLGCGANDWNSGRTAAATIADIQSFVTAAQAAAPLSKIIVQTVIDHINMGNGGGLGYTWKNTVNTAIRAISGITVVDTGANANLGCDGCSANTTYFQPDAVHPSGVNGVPPDANNNGITIQSGLAATALSSQGIQ